MIGHRSLPSRAGYPRRPGGGCMGRRRRVEGAAKALPEAIAALSQSLPGGPSPEIFRRAKFDRPEAVRLPGWASGVGQGVDPDRPR